MWFADNPKSQVSLQKSPRTKHDPVTSFQQYVKLHFGNFSMDNKHVFIIISVQAVGWPIYYGYRHINSFPTFILPSICLSSPPVSYVST